MFAVDDSLSAEELIGAKYDRHFLHLFSVSGVPCVPSFSTLSVVYDICFGGKASFWGLIFIKVYEIEDVACSMLTCVTCRNIANGTGLLFR
jgi:hypothetical protein